MLLQLLALRRPAPFPTAGANESALLIHWGDARAPVLDDGMDNSTTFPFGNRTDLWGPLSGFALSIRHTSNVVALWGPGGHFETFNCSDIFAAQYGANDRTRWLDVTLQVAVATAAHVVRLLVGGVQQCARRIPFSPLLPRPTNGTFLGVSAFSGSDESAQLLMRGLLVVQAQGKC